MTRVEIARRLLRLLRPLAPMMAVSASFRILNQGLGVAIPAVAAALVVSVGSDVGSLIALLAALALVKGTFRYVEQFTGHAIAFRLLSSLRVDTYRWIVPLAPAGLEEERTGDLVARVVGDIDRVEPFYAHTIAPLASAVVVPLLAAAGLAIWVDPVVALVFLPFPLLIAAVLPWLRARREAALASSLRQQKGETAAVLTDAVQGARELAVFEAKQSIVDQIDQISGTGGSLRRALSLIGAVRATLGDLLSAGAVVVTAAVAVSRFEAGVIGLVGLAAAIAVAWVGTAPARALEDIVPALEEALAAAGRIFELAERPPPVSPPSAATVAPGAGNVAFQDVTVHLGKTTALESIDVEIAGGAYVAVVGPSGAGKSTFVELLVRFRDPDRGTVSIGVVDAGLIAPPHLRAKVALVPQRPDLFYGTLGDNLRLAKPEAAEEVLWEALERAALGPWARSLEHGLETPIGELGETLSGGQRQRIAISRVFLREPDIVIVDEATSELDPPTERRVLAELARERGRRTLIVVAHRLETVVDADEILVLDRGRLVERGRHEDLAEAGGVYEGLWSRQRDFIPTAPTA